MLTTRQLDHIFEWAKHLCKDPNYNYTKWDANIAIAVERHKKEIASKNYYEKYKPKKLKTYNQKSKRGV